MQSKRRQGSIHRQQVISGHLADRLAGVDQDLAERVPDSLAERGAVEQLIDPRADGRRVAGSRYSPIVWNRPTWRPCRQE
ncbi:hypothetical protein E0H73_35795 [Kribbella pittospori]|uniref:Uncharacterized protein n=1 Tax=Kribbella pittospori TaxID=722689 RepID=A0A4R0KAP3_9ACTN|nr:hypothetical protein [Kribbella pittospori]TCC55296.1 hypothetical protein E0H73_35795 [Kribbella pittospori]